MRISFTVVDPLVDQRLDVVLDADPATPVAEVLEELAGRTRGSAGGSAGGRGEPVGSGHTPPHGARIISLASRRSDPGGLVAVEGWVLGQRLDPARPLAGSALREGSVLSLGDPSGCLPAEPVGALDVRVSSGPGAGVVHRLRAGEWTIGSHPSAGLRLEDPSVPGLAARLSVAPDGSCQVGPVEEGGATAGSLAGVAVARATPWPVGQPLRLGGVLLEAGLPTPADAAVHAAQDGAGLDYNRPPRMLPPLRTTRFRLPREPAPPGRRGFPLLMMLAPLLLSLGAVLIFHVWYYLLLGLLSPVTIAANYWQDRRSGKRSHRQELADFRTRSAAVEQEAAAALRDEVAARRQECPDPGTVLLAATGPRARLWERRRADPDHLLLRIGTADLPSEVSVENPEADQDHHRLRARTAPDVPVTVPLAEAGVLGIAGRGDLPRRLAGWALTQLAVLQSPRDVRFVVLTEATARDDWEWLRWLPHARPGMGQGEDGDLPVLLGNDADSLARRVGELGAVLAARQQAAGDTARAAATFRDPDLVVVLDGARRLRTIPGVVALLTQGPQVGIRAICLDADERLLPQECSAVVSQIADGLRVSRQRSDVVDGVRADLVSADWCERVARCLAPLRDVGESEDGASLPSAVRLLDVLGLEPPAPEAVSARWLVQAGSTRAVVGVGLDGPLALDLRRDGPHALIAGTTGAGKSELLQTLVAALAVANRPDAMTFVLVDYKGGSAFKDCVHLPHTVGMVTDLDEHLVRRALESLSAELRRREHVLAQAGAKDLEDYLDLAARDDALAPLPRLVIVIDEFASLARELPDFVTGLVNVAQRGRSLGIHLVLATQRPSGVVSPEIRANTNLRIALRVTDASESTDVVEAPDAARIARSTPGRGYVRLGHASLVPFQAARVGGRRPGAVASGAGSPWVRELGWADLGRPAPQRPTSTVQAAADDTDLAALVEAVRAAARRLALAPQPSPWLPALPERVLLDALPDPGPGAGPLPAVAWALEDLPGTQEQRSAVVDLARFGHLFVVGGPRSGRSQALRTIAGALAQRISTADVHLYGIDCGNGALLPLTALPQCGAVVQRTQTERAQRLVGRLAAELARRQELLATGGYADVTEQRRSVAPDDRLAHVVVLLDRWEGFQSSLGEVDGGALGDVVLALLREGASAGMHLVITGDRQLLSGRWSALTEDKLVLRLPDRTDFSLAGLAPRTLPETIADGRGFRADSAIETQIALLAADASGAGQAAALERIGATAHERDAEVPRARRPFRVDLLPARLGFEDAWAMCAQARGGLPPRPRWGLVGVGGDELVARGADLVEVASTFLVAGPGKSGRSSLLLTMAESFLRAGTAVVVLAPRQSPLRELAGRAGVRGVLAGDDVTRAELEALLQNASGDSGGPVGARGQAGVVLLVDDGELLKDCSAKDYLREVVRSGADHGLGLVLGGNIDGLCAGFSGWQVDVRKNRHGVLLCPQSITDGDLVGVRLPRSAVGGPVQPGRALLHDGSGELVTLQVPLPPQ